ncbi:MAG: ABC transporter ATP-binding protein [bacterium]|nr:MAG: ABC transporter ATP-binding protein [bacterium]
MSDQNSPEVVIDVQQVFKSFKQVKAVRGIDLQVYQGQFLALLGPNGAGKTTLVEMIEGIQKPDSGRIFIHGKSWKGNEESLHRLIGISLQETRFIDKLTVAETLRLFASFYQLPARRIEEIIELAGLQEKRKSYVVNLSGGQRQRLALGIALLNQPKILLLDEPTTGLDPTARRDIWQILLNLHESRQTSLILTTHYMEEAEQLCDFIVLIDKGKIISQGTLNQLLAQDKEVKNIEFSLEGNLSNFNISQIQKDIQMDWDEKSGKGILYIKSIENQLPNFISTLRANNISLKNIECRRPTLNDLFLSLTGRELHDA